MSDPSATERPSHGPASTAGGLIARLEAATDGSRELDGAIWLLVDPKAAKGVMTSGVPYGKNLLTDEAREQISLSRLRFNAPRFTSSIDAAITLVPEGWNRRVSESDTRKWWAELREGYETSYDRVIIATHPILPVAICIAALRARSPADPTPAVNSQD